MLLQIRQKNNQRRILENEGVISKEHYIKALVLLNRIAE
jgi:hypothetical protein